MLPRAFNPAREDLLVFGDFEDRSDFKPLRKSINAFAAFRLSAISAVTYEYLERLSSVPV
jgi:hypothetical protein